MDNTDVTPFAPWLNSYIYFYSKHCLSAIQYGKQDGGGGIRAIPFCSPIPDQGMGSVLNILLGYLHTALVT